MKMRAAHLSRRAAARALASCFRRNGHVRWQDLERAEKDGWRRYKKGDELRLVAESREELRSIQDLLQIQGFEPGRPFSKGRKYCLPLYGRDAVIRFLDMVDTVPED